MLLLFNLMSETKAKRDTLIFNVAMYVSCLQDAGVAKGFLVGIAINADDPE